MNRLASDAGCPCLDPFAGFFVAGSLRSVAVGLLNGRGYRVALASGRPHRMAAQARSFNAALRADRSRLES